PAPVPVAEAPVPVKPAPMPVAEAPIPVKPAPVPVAEAPMPVVEAPTPSPVLKAVPFNPYGIKQEAVNDVPKPSVVTQKPQSHYDTIIRFAAVEFEGTIKN
ncbi:MAG: hypothetical protein KGI83_04030, partial [Verrucomicrobiota bacterium]|nr:hypothetical protein [Verrucomicrobiota bacterium]